MSQQRRRQSVAVGKVPPLVALVAMTLAMTLAMELATELAMVQVVAEVR